MNATPSLYIIITVILSLQLKFNNFYCLLFNSKVLFFLNQKHIIEKRRLNGYIYHSRIHWRRNKTRMLLNILVAVIIKLSHVIRDNESVYFFLTMNSLILFLNIFVLFLLYNIAYKIYESEIKMISHCTRYFRADIVTMTTNKLTMANIDVYQQRNK